MELPRLENFCHGGELKMAKDLNGAAAGSRARAEHLQYTLSPLSHDDYINAHMV